MKNMITINRILVIINILLGFTIYFGLLFLIFLGMAQLIMSLVIPHNRKQLNDEITIIFGIYSFITVIIILGILAIYGGFIPMREPLFVIGVGTSIMMAFLHLRSTHLIKKYENT